MAQPKRLSSDMFSFWERLSGDKVMIFWWRQHLVFIHKLYGNKGNARDLCKSSKDLWVTCKDSRTILKLCMTPCEWRQLTGSYSWPPEAFGLGLGVGWLWERVGNVFQTKCFWIRKVNWNSEKLQFWMALALLWLELICRNWEYL